MFSALAFIVLLFQGQPQDRADRMLNLVTADQPLVASATVDAPINEVWKAWTTNEGITSWMVAAGEVELKIGGKYRTSYTKGSDLKGPDVIENTILAYDPGRMITIQNTRFPAAFPFKNTIGKVWTVIYMDPIDAGHTKVTVRMIGFDHSEESVQMRGFFKQGNEATLAALAKRFAK